MRKIILTNVCAIILIWLAVLPAQAVELHFEEGIYNEREYQEVIFITGEPVLLTGTVQKGGGRGGRGGRDNTGNLSTSLTYRLQNHDGSITLTRTASYSSTAESKMDNRQTIYVTDLDRLTETITVGSRRYTLTDHLFSRSALVDTQPAVDYFSGTWTGRKTYAVNGNQGQVIVEFWGDTVGYEHAWGSTETQRIDGTIRFQGDVTIEERTYPQNWSGTFQVNISFNRTRDLTYHANEPTPISFAGGYIETIQEEGVLRYEANLPEFDRDGLVRDSWGRRHVTGSTRLATMPTQRWLPVPSYRDLENHWARGPILELASLESFSTKGDYFGPRLDMSRGEFAYALVKLTDLQGSQAAQEQTQTFNPFDRFRNQETQEVSPFSDVATSHPSYQQIKAISEANIMTGVTPGRFSPDGTLTRAEAITAMIKALGFERLAPLQNPITPYNDDRNIPYWARDAIYVAAEMGIVSGDSFGNVLPNQAMSRAEAAVFLQRFVHYLQHDLKTEYRERLINFR
jgi:hypothetical protein